MDSLVLYPLDAAAEAIGCTERELHRQVSAGRVPGTVTVLFYGKRGVGSPMLREEAVEALRLRHLEAMDCVFTQSESEGPEVLQ